MLEDILIYGLINSAIIILMTIGFTFAFGVSGVANFAHGAFYICSGYIMWIMLNALKLPFFLAILLTIAITALLGALMYWAVLWRLRGLILSEVIATFAIGVAILEFFRWAGFITYEFSLPIPVKGGVEVAGVPVDYYRLLIVGVGFAIMLFVWFFTHHTRLGLLFRAIAQEEFTAMSLGVKSDLVAMLSLAFSSALVAVAAITILPLGIINVNLGYDVLLIALAVAVVGGLESIAGTVVAGLIIGYAQVIVSKYLAPHWMMMVYLVMILVILTIKPSGLLGKFKEIEERV